MDSCYNCIYEVKEFVQHSVDLLVSALQTLQLKKNRFLKESSFEYWELYWECVSCLIIIADIGFYEQDLFEPLLCSLLVHIF